MLSKKAVDEYKKIYKKVYRKEITDAEVLEQGTRLFNLFRIIYNPTPKSHEKEKEVKSHL